MYSRRPRRKSTYEYDTPPEREQFSTIPSEGPLDIILRNLSTSELNTTSRVSRRMGEVASRNLRERELPLLEEILDKDEAPLLKKLIDRDLTRDPQTRGFVLTGELRGFDVYRLDTELFLKVLKNWPNSKQIIAYLIDILLAQWIFSDEENNQWYVLEIILNQEHINQYALVYLCKIWPNFTFDEILNFSENNRMYKDLDLLKEIFSILTKENIITKISCYNKEFFVKTINLRQGKEFIEIFGLITLDEAEELESYRSYLIFSKLWNAINWKDSSEDSYTFFIIMLLEDSVIPNNREKLHYFRLISKVVRKYLENNEDIENFANTVIVNILSTAIEFENINDILFKVHLILKIVRMYEKIQEEKLSSTDWLSNLFHQVSEFLKECSPLILEELDTDMSKILEHVKDIPKLKFGSIKDYLPNFREQYYQD